MTETSPCLRRLASAVRSAFPCTAPDAMPPGGASHSFSHPQSRRHPAGGSSRRVQRRTAPHGRAHDSRVVDHHRHRNDRSPHHQHRDDRFGANRAQPVLDERSGCDPSLPARQPAGNHLGPRRRDGTWRRDRYAPIVGGRAVLDRRLSGIGSAERGQPARSFDRRAPNACRLPVPIRKAGRDRCDGHDPDLVRARMDQSICVAGHDADRHAAERHLLHRRHGRRRWRRSKQLSGDRDRTHNRSTSTSLWHRVRGMSG